MALFEVADVDGAELSARIQSLALTFIRDGQLEAVRPSRRATLVGGVLRARQEQWTLNIDRRSALIFAVLAEVIDLIHLNRHETVRDIYYRLKGSRLSFRDSSECDSVVLACTSLLRCPRHCLRLAASSKGSFSGALDWRREGEADWRSANGDNPVISKALRFKHWPRRQATFILVVEKDAIFQHLIQTNFTRLNPCIVITGRGFPDIRTREFLSKLAAELHLPVIGLCDWNPFGYGVMLTYMQGSERSPESYLYAKPEMRILGHVEEEDFSACFQPFVEADRRRARGLLRSEFVSQYRPRLKEEVEFMQSCGVKLELEAFHAIGAVRGDPDFFVQRWLQREIAIYLRPTNPSLTRNQQ